MNTAADKALADAKQTLADAAAKAKSLVDEANARVADILASAAKDRQLAAAIKIAADKDASARASDLAARAAKLAEDQNAALAAKQKADEAIAQAQALVAKLKSAMQ